jgi:Predicted dehydrogenases and related proteins
MKVLLVGCGSIGKRHLENLSKIAGVKQIFVYTAVKNCLSGLKDRSKVLRVRSLENIKADMAIIADETCKHLDTALILAKKRMHLFIEKPVSDTLSSRLGILEKISKRNNLKIGIGYNLRFLGALKFIKAKLSRKAIGDIYFVKIEAGQYLPHWRADRDYRASYSASKKRGGGVALDLSHEIDYMRYLFGNPHSWKVLKAKVSDLEINTEDIFEGIYDYGNFLCSVHLDYLQKDKKRIIRIEGAKGTITCDMVNKKIKIKTGDRIRVFSDKKLFDLNKTYSDEVLDFLKSIKNGSAPKITLNDGIKALELIEDKNV